MQYIDVPGCEKSDVKLVAKVVERLMRAESPSSTPGPVSGILAVHSFCEWKSPITYEMVG